MRPSSLARSAFALLMIAALLSVSPKAVAAVDYTIGEPTITCATESQVTFALSQAANALPTGDVITIKVWWYTNLMSSNSGDFPLGDSSMGVSLPEGALDGEYTYAAYINNSPTAAKSGGFSVICAPGGYTPVVPSRVFDSRSTGGTLSAGETRSVQVAGHNGVPTSGASAVVLNVTVTETTTAGYLTVSPTGTTRPTASNLNWSPGVTIPNAVTVKLGTDGKIDLYQSGPGTAQVIVDVSGYYRDGVVEAAGGYTPLSPARILDTRTDGGKLTAGESRDLQISGAGGIPASNVSAVILNVTVSETTTGGYLSVNPTGTANTWISNLNWAKAGVTIPNSVVVKVGDGGKVTLLQSGPGTAQVIVDVAGYFLGGTPTEDGMFVALPPARLMDTRQTALVPIAGGTDLWKSFAGLNGFYFVRASAAVVNVTVTQTMAGGYLTVFPTAPPYGPPPTASNLNWSAPGTTVPNLVIVRLGGNGTLTFHNGSPGGTHIIADFAGYYIGD